MGAEEMTKPQILSLIKQSWKSNYKYFCPFIVWKDCHHLDQILIIIDNLSAQQLIHIIRTLSVNFSKFQHGMPDLIIFNKKNKKSFMMIETKSGRENISFYQKLWIRWLLHLGIDVRITNVLTKE